MFLSKLYGPKSVKQKIRKRLTSREAFADRRPKKVKRKKYTRLAIFSFSEKTHIKDTPISPAPVTPQIERKVHANTLKRITK